MTIDPHVSPADLTEPLDRMYALASEKVRRIERTWDPARGAPVSTVDGRYTARGWTEWTQGFQYGCAILAFDVTGERDLLELGRASTLNRMAPHVSNVGVHDHGFNNVS